MKIQNTYLLISEDDYLYLEYEQKIIESANVDQINTIRYSDLTNNFDDFIEEIHTISFFSEKKVVIVKDIELILDQTQQRIDAFVNYLKKPNNDTILVLRARKKIENANFLKHLQNFSYIEELKKPSIEKLTEFVKTLVFNHEITDENLNILIERCDFDLLKINNEVKKIVTYLSDATFNTISLELIHDLVPKRLEDRIYELVNLIVEKKSSKTLEAYQDLLVENSPLRILNSISSRLIRILIVKELIANKVVQKEIGEQLLISSGQAYYLIKDAAKFSYPELIDSLARLQKADVKIKSGHENDKMIVELYLLGG